MTAPDLDELGTKVRNWGRWGPDDERGTLNFITPQKVAQAAGLVRQGKVFSLAIPFDRDGPQTGRRRRTNPIHTMALDGGDFAATGGENGLGIADDMVVMFLQCATQWDSLAHVFWKGKLYNGHGWEVITSSGAQKNSIDKVARGIISRGVLLDLARSKGVEMLEAGYVVTPQDMDACAKAQGVEVASGDVLLLRTGYMRKFTMERDRDAYMGTMPGIGLEVAPWLHRREVAAVAADTMAVEVMPSQVPGVRIPLHVLLIRDMGMTLGEMFNLDELAEDCARDGVYEFLFVGPPLPVTRAVGSPVNPLAAK
ncbi:MAG: cyclase family protein [Chloroflexi bacterium]|nr:cyclase family protein [Chloroflexota bacterium]